jgi:hypothetical protein
MHSGTDGEPSIELKALTRVDEGPTYEQLQEDSVLSHSCKCVRIKRCERVRRPVFTGLRTIYARQSIAKIEVSSLSLVGWGALLLHGAANGK